MPEAKPERVRSIESLLQNIASSSDVDLSPDGLKRLRNDMQAAVKSQFPEGLSREAVVWLTDRYFKAINVSHATGEPDQSMMDLVVLNEYDLNDLTIDDVKTLYDVFSTTLLGQELATNLKKRSS